MLEEIFDNDVGDGWTYHGFEYDSTDSQHVASHSCGVEIFVDTQPRQSPTGLLCTISHTVRCDGIIAEPVTNSEYVESDSALVGFLRERVSQISSMDERISAFAIVPHNGTLGSVNVDVLDDPNPESITKSSMADVFCVWNDSLPSEITIADLRNCRTDLVRTVYGDTTADLPETLESVSSEAAAYGKTSIDCYTVTDEELRIESKQTPDDSFKDDTS